MPSMDELMRKRWVEAKCPSCDKPFKFRTSDYAEIGALPSWRKCSACTDLKNAEDKFQDACKFYGRAVAKLERKGLTRDELAKVLGKTDLHRALLNLLDNQPQKK